MGLEAATYINELVPTNPVGATDPKAQGDDHLRLIKQVLQNTFPNINGVVNATDEQLNLVAGAFAGLANPTALAGPTPVNGVATTAMRSDGAPAINQTANYSWTGTHTFVGINFGANAFTGVANPSVSVGLTAKNGAAATAMRSDAAPALDQTITPVWTGQHLFIKSRSVAGEYGWTIQAAAPVFLLNETDAALDNRKWSTGAFSEQLGYYALNDAENIATPWLVIDRTNTTIDTVNFPNGVLQYGGQEVGYRDLIRTDVSTSFSVVDSSAGRMYRYTGGAGNTCSIPNNTVRGGGIITIVNDSTASLSIVGTGGMVVGWYNGSGVVPTGARTLAGGGVLTINVWATNYCGLWGVGLS
jgi:hypothetical protein